MAAYKAGCSTVIIPAENSKDLQEIGEEVKAGVRFVPVDTFDQVLPIALEYMPITYRPGGQARRRAGGQVQACRSPVAQ